MDKRLKEIEEKLCNYFNRSKRLHALNKRLKLLKDQVSEINYKLGHIDYNLPDESIAVGYEERVQTSPTGYSFAERTLYNITDRLLKNRGLKEQQIADIEDRIMQMEEDNSIIEDNIESLDEEYIQFLKIKYKSKKKDWQVAQELNMSQPNATRTKNKLIANIDNWFRFVKCVH
jgi:predicted  nucleic acid-binding Zn-ribbon protein